MFSIFSNQKNSRVYLDHAGATPVSDVAKKALQEALLEYGNPSGIHKEGAVAQKFLQKARTMCAEVINSHSYEIYFLSSGTESTNTAIQGVVNAYKKDHTTTPHIITSVIEHPSVLEPIKQLEKRGEITVTYVPVNEEGMVSEKDIREALQDTTILVSIMYANNEIGTIQPVKEIGRAIDEWKTTCGRTFTSYPYFHTDACQAANYCNLDVLRLKCHLMSVNSSKVYGPKGAAFLYKREGIKVDPIIYGGGQERELRSGTEAMPLYYSFAHALKETKDKHEDETTRLEVLNDYAREKLKQAIPSIIFYGAFDELKPVSADGTKTKRITMRLPNNINCRVPGISSEEMILRLDAKGFAVSHKSACASMETDGSYVITALGKTEEEALENIRISFGRSTTPKDVDTLVVAMKSISEKYTK